MLGIIGTIICAIGIVLALAFVAICYCEAMANEEPDYKEKYMNQLKINKELLNEILKDD